MIDAPDAFAGLAGLGPARLVSEGALLQLLLVFILSPVRSDPFVIGPLVALYAQREDDRQAMRLYLILSAAGALFDVVAVFSGAGIFISLVSLLALGLKAAIALPAVRVHDKLPELRPARVEPTKLQERVQQVVQQVLREELQRLHGKAATKAPAGAAHAPASTAAQSRQPAASAAASGTEATSSSAVGRSPAAGQNAWDEV